MRLTPIARLFAHRPKTVILLFSIFTITVGSQITNLYMVSNFSSYLPKDDPTLKLWEEINERFELGSSIIILINQTDRTYNDIRDYEILKEMDEIHRALYDNPRIEGKELGISSIQSLAYYIRKENAKDFPMGNANDDIPKETRDIIDYMERITVKSAEGVLYTTDYKYAAIIIQLDPGADFDEALKRTQNAIDNRGVKHAHMTITGTIAMQKAVQKESMNNLILVFPIALTLVAIVLIIFHRSIKGIIIAFLPPAFALILTFGTLGIFTPELTLISVAIVSLLMGLGVDYSIHLMNRLVEEKQNGNIEDRIEIILRSTGKAVLLTTITTIIGFGSLMISSMSPMVTFGFGCAIGIFYCFLTAIILVPCLVVITKFDKKGILPKWEKFAKFVLKNKRRIIFISLFFAIMSLILLPMVKTDVNYLTMAPDDIPELEAMYEYSEIFGGGGNFNAFLVETDSHGLEDPDVINALYNMSELMRAKGVKVSSIADTLKELNEILTKNVIIEKFSNLTDIENIVFDRIAKEGVVNEDHSVTVILINIPIGKSIQEIEKLVKDLNTIAEETTLPRNGRISELTGQDAVNVAVNKIIYDEQARSMVLALILVLAVLILIFSSAKYGFLTMIPVFFVLMWEPGFLVAFEIPLSLVTLTIASIMVGIGIDYGVHITHRIREEMEKGFSKTEAIITAIEKTGLSLVEAALTTIAGMASIFFIGITALNEFVIVIIFMVSMSCVAAALILPIIYNSKLIKT